VTTKQTQFEAGDVIADRYRVERVLGRGGMGEVYLVSDARHGGRRLALKVLQAQHSRSKEVVHRFGREVRTLRKLQHPGVARIHEARQWAGLFYYTMDYIDGRSVRRWLTRRGRLSLGSVTRVLALVAGVLEEAHRFTIHRDISPENVMVLNDGSVRLLDFGLAKLTEAGAPFTRIGVSMGKVQYNSPEMLSSAAEADHRADLYSLGVMYYEMLTGELPQAGKAIHDLVPDAPREAQAFFEKATAAKPENRFQSAAEFRRGVLEAYAAQQARLAKLERRRERWRRFGRWWTRLRLGRRPRDRAG
jgi:serine/threonine protein kinase